ncbi:MAG: hypothetical protein KGL02_00435 [Acidobacteriota bacterium]|nr:hypothetical protein [Acidobacteriota bacterium]MDE3169620.1 hypothetical protein [Acidobacteriota bacterium]
MVILLIIGSQALMQNVATEGRRMREQQTIWRGEQVERAIRLYYHKTGHYPQTFDDLQSGLPELHFLRETAVKNPMNKTDGTWRFIYVNAAGQIIGSVKYATLQQMAVLDLNRGKFPPVAPGAVSASSLAAGSHQPSQNASQSSNAGPGQVENPLAALKPTGPVDGPVPGAFLTGVAGKTGANSLIVYKGGKKYLDWEFIWNPIEDQARALQQTGGPSNGLLPNLTNLPGMPAGLTGTGNPGTPGTQTGTSPASPGAPANPMGTPPPSNTPPPDTPPQDAPPPNSD